MADQPSRNLNDVATILFKVGGKPFPNISSSSSSAEDDQVCVTLSSITVSPASQTVFVGDTQQMTATGTYTDGSTLNLTSAVTWSISDGSIATITNGSAGGLLAATAGGSGSIIASVSGVTGSTGLVTQAPGNYATIINGSTSLNNPSTAAKFQFAIPWWVPAGTTQFRVRIASRNSLTGAGGAAITGVYGAVGPHDGSGGFSSAPQTFGPVTIPASGALYTGDFLTSSRGSGSGEVLVAYFIPASREIFYNTQVVGYANYSSTASAAYPLDSLSANPSFNVLSVMLDVGSPGVRYTVLGDSLSIGQNCSNLNKCVYRLLQTTDGISCATAGIGGVSLEDYANPIGKPWLWDYVDVGGSKIILEAGVNDLDTRTLLQMQTDYTTVVAYLRSRGATRIVAQTLTASGTYVAGNAVRVNFNTWLKTLPLSINACADVATALDDPGTPTQLLAAYDSGDTLHWSDAGHAAALPVILAAL